MKITYLHIVLLVLVLLVLMLWLPGLGAAQPTPLLAPCRTLQALATPAGWLLVGALLAAACAAIVALVLVMLGIAWFGHPAALLGGCDRREGPPGGGGGASERR